MKKMLFLILLTFGSFFVAQSQSLTAFAYSRGVSPIPAFAIEDPAAIVFIKTNLTDNLEFAPDLAYNLGQGGGWFMDSWLRWNQALDPDCKWRATVGANYSLVFNEHGTNGSAISQAVDYFVFQGKLRYAFNEHNRLILDYWYNLPVSKYGIEGHYFSLVYMREQEISHAFELELKANAFVVNFDDGTSGLAFAPEGALRHKKTGLFAGIHFLQPLTLDGDLEVAGFAGITRKLH